MLLLICGIDPNSIFIIITKALFFVLIAEMEFWDTGGMNKTSESSIITSSYFHIQTLKGLLYMLLILLQALLQLMHQSWFHWR